MSILDTKTKVKFMLALR